MVSVLIVIGFMLDVFAIALRSWFIKVLWGWFIVPLGVIDISTVHAMGLSIMFGLVTIGIARKELAKEPDDEVELWITKTTMKLAYVFGQTFLMLAAWAAHSLMN